MRIISSKIKAYPVKQGCFTLNLLKKISLITALLMSISVVGGCSWLQFPGVYKLAIEQGNIITQEMVDQLKPGMSKRQVNFVLGTPLVQDSFKQDRWDYYYSLRDSKGKTTKEKFTVFFDGDNLTHFSGNYQPAAITKNPDDINKAAEKMLKEKAAGLE